MDPISTALMIIFIFSILSYLWKPNIFFDVVLALFVGFTTVHVFITNIASIQNAGTRLIGGDLMYIVPILIGILSWTRLSEKYRWLDRYTIGALIGTGMGINLRSVPKNIIVNLQAALLPLNSIDNLAVILGFITPIIFFIFTRKEAGILKYPAQIGRYFYMTWVGAVYMSIAISRLTYLTNGVQMILESLGFIL